MRYAPKTKQQLSIETTFLSGDFVAAGGKVTKCKSGSRTVRGWKAKLRD